MSIRMLIGIALAIASVAMLGFTIYSLLHPRYIAITSDQPRVHEIIKGYNFKNHHTWVIDNPNIEQSLCMTMTAFAGAGRAGAVTVQCLVNK